MEGAAPPERRKKITIMTGVFNEEVIVSDVYRAVRAVFEDLADRYDYEHIFLDNCSTDSTLAILKSIAREDKRVKILSYSKNFGPIKSGVMGFLYSTGDAVIPYEGNMKDPPEMIATFLKHWEEGYQVVYGYRPRTADNPLMLACRKLFYKIVAHLSDEPMPENFGGFCLLDRRVVDELNKIDDYKPYSRGLIASIGFKQLGIEYQRRARPKGKSKSRFGYLVDFAINAVVSYSIVPIRFCTYIGMFLSGMSFLAAIAYALLKILVWNFQAPGATTVVILIFFFSGIQLFFLGVLGEYVGAIHSQVRRKPFVVINEKINIDDEPDRP